MMMLSIEFSPGCTKFEGPNPLQCYINEFLDAGCIANGTANPGNYPDPVYISQLDGFNLL